MLVFKVLGVLFVLLFELLFFELYFFGVSYVSLELFIGPILCKSESTKLD